jgi:hypothetical protein
VSAALDPHLSMVRPVAPRTPDGCEECLQLGAAWVQLRLCLTCGHVGCCDSSPLRHAYAVGHPMVQSFEPGGGLALVLCRQSVRLSPAEPPPTPGLPETPDTYGAYPRLSDAQIAALAALGQRRSTQSAEVLFHEGERNCDFFVVLAGTAAVVEARAARRRSVSSACTVPGAFLVSSAC